MVHSPLVCFTYRDDIFGVETSNLIMRYNPLHCVNRVKYTVLTTKFSF